MWVCVRESGFLPCPALPCASCACCLPCLLCTAAIQQQGSIQGGPVLRPRLHLASLGHPVGWVWAACAAAGRRLRARGWSEGMGWVLRGPQRTPAARRPGRPGTRPAACLPAAADAARDFFQACLNRDEKERPTAEQLLEHPWLQVRGRSGVPRAAAVRTWAHVGGCKAYSALRVNSEHLRTVEAVNSAALSPLCARPCCPPTGRPGGERRPV